MSKNKEENRVGINPEVIEVKITGENPDLEVADDFIVLKDVNSIRKTSGKNSKAFKKAQKRKAREAAKSKGEKPQSDIPHVDDVKEDGHAKDGNEKTKDNKEEINFVIPPSDNKESGVGKKISMFRDKCKANLSAMIKLSVEAKSFKSKVYGGMILEWADSSADFIERVLMQTVDIAFIDKYCKAIDAFHKEKSESFNLMLTAKKIDVIPFDIDKGVYSLSGVRAVCASYKLFKAIKEKTPKSDTFEERTATFFKWAKEDTSSVKPDNNIEDENVKTEEVVMEAVTEKTEDGKEEIKFSNLPSTNKEFEVDEKISSFRAKCKTDLSVMVKLAVFAKSFKSKVYGGMIVEWADSSADFIERVLMQTVDIAFIDKYCKIVGDGFHKEKTKSSSNVKTTSSQFNKSIYAATSKLFKETEEKSEPFNVMISTKKIDVVPFDIDERIYSLAGERVLIATSKLFKEIEDETFECDTFEERTETFFKWAEENTLFLMTDGPKGCKIGFRDCDGNIYDQHKKLFTAEVAA